MHRLLFFTPLVLVVSGFAQSGFSPNALDRTANPCENFYQYACGNWVKNNPIPPDQARWARFSELQERNQRILKDVLETSVAKQQRTPTEQKIGDYYSACMDVKGVEARGTSPLKPELERIAALQDKRDLAETLATLHNIGTGGFFSFYAQADYKNAQRVIPQANQGGLTLPDRDYYLNADAKSLTIRKQYAAHVQKMFSLLGWDDARASAAPKAILNTETELARLSMDRVSQRNPNNTYHLMSREDLLAATPSFNWEAYLKARNVPAFEQLNIVNPAFYKGLEAYLKTASLDDIKTYLIWKHLNASAEALPAAFGTEHFEMFDKTLQGAKEQKPRWKRCVAAVDSDLGEALGEKYVEVAFAGDSKQRILELVHNLESAMSADIEAIDWMSAETKKRASEKLTAITEKIGYPDKWREYTFAVKPDDFLGNSQRANVFSDQRNLSKIVTGPNPKEWNMTPPTVNAYYNSLQNNINFPAGILQPPFFDPKLDDAVNYGAIGAVIGHEMTHGFDDQGRRFNGQGNMTNWWTDTDGKEFEKRASCIDKQYSAFTVAGDVKLNGKLTLGENVADNGGARLAYMALLRALRGKREEKIEGFTAQQRFFLGFAQIWCSNSTDESARLRALTDPHSPGLYRTNGTVSNMPEFWEAFSCKPGQAMYRGENACRVW